MVVRLKNESKKKEGVRYSFKAPACSKIGLEKKKRLAHMQEVRSFLEEYINSTLAPGKKDAITCRKIKK